MNLHFERRNGYFISEFEVTNDFNLHIEKDPIGQFIVYQRTAGGAYDLVADFGKNKGDDPIIDYDFSALVYPKWIKIKSAVKPLIATITTDGEVNEVVYQAKDIEITSNGTTKVTADTGYTALASVNVKVNVPTEGGGENSGSGSKWTGHADAEGLKAIGWTDEDIQYYQTYGVNWNEEDDEYHKVSEDNKALYGVLTANNISTYKDRIVYLPKIDTGGMTDMYYYFNCPYMVGMPKIDTSNVTDFSELFYDCSSLAAIPELDFSNATTISEFICYTTKLRVLPPLDLSKTNITYCDYLCNNALGLERIENLVLPKGAKWASICEYAYNLQYARIDLTLAGQSGTSSYGSLFGKCFSLIHAYIKGLHESLNLSDSPLLSKDSLLYIIDNETATSAITITLHTSAYARLATDADIVAALANHPNITLAK